MAPSYTPPLTRPTSPNFPRTLSHARTTYQTWERLRSYAAGEDFVRLDGDSLDIAALVAVARFGAIPALDKSQKVLDAIDGSIKMLHAQLATGDNVYGVNTGFGGSADTRTSDLRGMQEALVQHQTSGVLTSNDIGRPHHEGRALDPLGDFNFHSMPTPWVRGTILTRVNSIIRGHSAVSLQIIENLVTLIQQDLIPVIPLRGSISASGDLSPLSYIAGTLQGNPDIFVRTGKLHGSRVVTAAEALKAADLQPVVLAAKEGLGLINGTAVSASVASLAMYETHHLAVLSQVLTAMGCEALHGTAESFHPFIASVRPHKGQAEAASNILSFLTGSRLAQGVLTEADSQMSGLCQDRYPLRTASQWIGPQLEDLLLAHDQLTVELNSTTDNPLIDVAHNLMHHGGNFQAASVTSAMEKTRLTLQMLGKLLFAQGTEIINPALNKGLPPNLSADDPSLSFTCKSIDINLAAYMAELAFLANPVSTHVQSAEMHNQAVNSLALISGRYTLQAVEILSLMSAAYLFLVCQALDLRVLQTMFFKAVKPRIEEATASLSSTAAPTHDPAKLCAAVWMRLAHAWDAASTLDLPDRSAAAATAAATVLTEPGSGIESLAEVRAWAATTTTLLASTYDGTRNTLFADYLEITPTYLGLASRALYAFVRRELGVPLHRGLVDSPTHVLREGGPQPSVPEKERRSIGSLVSGIYEAVRDGRVGAVVMGVVRDGLLK